MDAPTLIELYGGPCDGERVECDPTETPSFACIPRFGTRDPFFIENPQWYTFDPLTGKARYQGTSKEAP